MHLVHGAVRPGDAGADHPRGSIQAAISVISSSAARGTAGDPLRIRRDGARPDRPRADLAGPRRRSLAALAPGLQRFQAAQLHAGRAQRTALVPDLITQLTAAASRVRRADLAGVPRRGTVRLDPVNGSIRPCNDLLDSTCSTVLSNSSTSCGAATSGFWSLRSVTAMSPFPRRPRGTIRGTARRKCQRNECCRCDDLCHRCS